MFHNAYIHVGAPRKCVQQLVLHPEFSRSRWPLRIRFCIAHARARARASNEENTMCRNASFHVRHPEYE
eukprot:4692373-Pyramimonas_sp.AAC.1